MYISRKNGKDFMFVSETSAIFSEKLTITLVLRKNATFCRTLAKNAVNSDSM
jgi:hypothetical protein